MLKTAKDFGWVPRGTILRLPGRGEEGGDYVSNDNQIVSQNDAQQILEALMRALNTRAFVDQIHTDMFGIVVEFKNFLRNGAFRIR